MREHFNHPLARTVRVFERPGALHNSFLYSFFSFSLLNPRYIRTINWASCDTGQAFRVNARVCFFSAILRNYVTQKSDTFRKMKNSPRCCHSFHRASQFRLRFNGFSPYTNELILLRCMYVCMYVRARWYFLNSSRTHGNSARTRTRLFPALLARRSSWKPNFTGLLFSSNKRSFFSHSLSDPPTDSSRTWFRWLEFTKNVRHCVRIER